MQAYNLEQGVVLKVSGPSFLSTKYVMAQFEFPNTGGDIINVPVRGLEKQGQIINMRVTSETGNAIFTLHKTLLEEASPFGIVIQATTENELDVAVNELWFQWNVTDTTKEPYLWVSCQHSTGVPGRVKVELILAN